MELFDMLIPVYVYAAAVAATAVYYAHKYGRKARESA
jgi:hypothetical protein